MANPSASPGNDALPDFFAAVDLGSNSFHLKVVRLAQGELQVVDRMRDMVRLAASLDADNRLTEDGMLRAISCLERFGQRLRDVPSAGVRVVGTNTLRRARNAAEFLHSAEAALGHPIEVIAGREEARLIYLGVAHSVAADPRSRLVVDIGGGSTELIIGRDFDALFTESLHMGCVSSSTRHFPRGRITSRAMKEAELSASQELEPIRSHYLREGWQSVLGASGTVRAIDQVIASRGWSEVGITLGALQRLRETLVQAGHIDDFNLPRAHAERAPVFAGGVAILLAIFEALRIRRMTAADGALREGLLYDAVGRLQQHDVRDATIQNLSRRFQIDVEQAARVERTALYLHRQVARSWRLRKRRYRDLLGWSARLHEIGLDIAHNQYHKHGEYLLRHADLPGFSQQDKALLAVLVRAHRRRFPVGAIRILGDRTAERIGHLAVLLRLSVIAHRSRTDTTIPGPGITAEAGSGSLRLAFPPGWLDAHPLTRTELEEESEALASISLKLRFD